MKKPRLLDNIPIFFISLAIAFAALNFQAPARSQGAGALSSKELNTQNMALNRCEQYIKSDRIEEALRAFNEASAFTRACDLNPNYARVRSVVEKARKDYVKKLTDSGNNFFMAKKFEESKTIFKKILIIDPSNAQARDKVNVCEEQLKFLQRARETHHNPGMTITQIEKINSQLLKEESLKALDLLKKKNLQEALEIFKKCAAKDGGNPYFKDKIKYIENLISITRIVKKFNEDAQRDYSNPTCEILLNKLGEQDPEYKKRIEALEEKPFSKHLFVIGNYYLALNNLEKAEVMVKKCLEFIGEREESIYALGVIYYKKSLMRMSFNQFKLLRAFPALDSQISSSVRFYYYELLIRIYKTLFLTLILQACILASVAYKGYPIIDYAFDRIITRILTFSLHDADYYYEAGVAAFNGQRFDRAISSLKKCIAMKPANINVNTYYYLGVSYYKNKVYDQARRSLESVMRTVPNHQRAAYYLALIYDGIKLQKDAIRMLEIARGIAVTQRSFSTLEIEKNRLVYMGVFQDYKLAADKILNLSEPMITIS